MGCRTDYLCRKCRPAQATDINPPEPAYSSAGALAARRRFAEAYLNGPLLRQLSVCLRLLLKLLLERAIFRFVGHPLKSNGTLKIFREHFHVHGTSHLRRLLRYPVHAHNQPTNQPPSGPVRRTYLPETRNQSRFAFGSTDSVNFCFIFRA